MAFFWSGFRGVDVFLIAENQEKIPPTGYQWTLPHSRDKNRSTPLIDVTEIRAPPLNFDPPSHYCWTLPYVSGVKYKIRTG